jgi:hypothetical protein
MSYEMMQSNDTLISNKNLGPDITTNGQADAAETTNKQSNLQVTTNDNIASESAINEKPDPKPTNSSQVPPEAIAPSESITEDTNKLEALPPPEEQMDNERLGEIQPKKTEWLNEYKIHDIKTIFDSLRNMGICIAIMLGLPSIKDSLTSVCNVDKSLFYLIVAVLTVYLVCMNIAWTVKSLQEQPRFKISIHLGPLFLGAFALIVFGLVSIKTYTLLDPSLSAYPYTGFCLMDTTGNFMFNVSTYVKSVFN